MWFGSQCGVKKWSSYGFSTYAGSDGIEEKSINSIFENAAGELFAVINDAGRTIYKFENNRFTGIKPRLPSEVNYVGWGWNQIIGQDVEGAWLIPTARGLYRSAASFENLAETAARKVPVNTKAAEIFRVFVDSRGDVWIVTISDTASELWRWERAANVWRDYTAETGFSIRRIGAAFAEDKRGNLWITTGEDDSALIRYSYADDKFRVFTQAEGAPAGWTKSLYLDEKNRLWLASGQDGLLRLDDTTADNLNFVRYTTADNLSSNNILCVTGDAFGRIYAGTGRGVDRINPDTREIKHYTTADGLPSSDAEIAYRDRANALWFGTAKGLARFLPEPERKRQPPTILITGLRAGGEPQMISILGEAEIPELNLASDQRQITVEFLGLGASLGERLIYEYRLNTGDWTRTDERTVNFANLSSGANHFEVRAQTADRIYSQPAVISFNIAAPVYQRPWFIASMIFLTALTIFGIYRYRLNKLLEVERTRTRIASDLHDDIGTNLSKISLLSEIVNLQLAEQNIDSRKLLNSIAEISRESVGSMSDIVWAINPKRDSVLELVRRMRLHVEELFLDKDVRVIFNAPDGGEQIKLSMNIRRELFLIFKEAVSNAARHSGCTNIEIDFHLENNSIFLNITDDGKGFDTENKTDGNGLENMRSRAAKNGGKFKIETKPEGGTTIKIRFPQN